MMSGHSANPILEVRRPKHSLTPLSPPTSDNISFLPYPPPPQCGRHMCISPKVNFKIYDVTNWTTNNYNTNIAQHLKK